MSPAEPPEPPPGPPLTPRPDAPSTPPIGPPPDPATRIQAVRPTAPLGDWPPPHPDPHITPQPWPAPTGITDQLPVPQPVRRRRRWPIVVGALVGMALVVLAVVADWGARNYELSQLLTRIEASEAAMMRYQQQVHDVEVPRDPTAEQRQEVAAALRSAAAQGRTAVAAAGDRVAELSFLPWHGDVLEAQESYLAHNHAWVDHLQRGSQDVTVLLGADPLIDSTWTTAEVEVRDAAPWPAWPGLGSRLDAIFAPSEDNSDPGLPA